MIKKQTWLTPAAAYPAACDSYPSARAKRELIPDEANEAGLIPPTFPPQNCPREMARFWRSAFERYTLSYWNLKCVDFCVNLLA